MLATKAIGTHELRHVNDCHDLKIACDCDLQLPQVTEFVGVNMLNNFEFSCDTATVWRAFDVGKGKHTSKIKNWR